MSEMLWARTSWSSRAMRRPGGQAHGGYPARNVAVGQHEGDVADGEPGPSHHAMSGHDDGEKRGDEAEEDRPRRVAEGDVGQGGGEGDAIDGHRVPAPHDERRRPGDEQQPGQEVEGVPVHLMPAGQGGAHDLDHGDPGRQCDVDGRRPAAHVTTVRPPPPAVICRKEARRLLPAAYIFGISAIRLGENRISNGGGKPCRRRT
jgi:hypothetical protein